MYICEMKSIRINMENRLYCNLKEYCEANHIKIGRYISNCVERSLYTDKYGDLNKLFGDRDNTPSASMPTDDISPEIKNDRDEESTRQAETKENTTRKIRRVLKYK